MYLSLCIDMETFLISEYYSYFRIKCILHGTVLQEVALVPHSSSNPGSTPTFGAVSVEYACPPPLQDVLDGRLVGHCKFP